MSGILRKPRQMATYYSHWRHALLIHDGDLFPRKRFRQRIRFFIMTPVSPPWVHRKLRRRETYDGNSAGSPALSAFRINKLLARFQAAGSRFTLFTPSMSILLTSMRLKR